RWGEVCGERPAAVARGLWPGDQKPRCETTGCDSRSREQFAGEPRDRPARQATGIAVDRDLKFAAARRQLTRDELAPAGAYPPERTEAAVRRPGDGIFVDAEGRCEVA